MGPDYIQFYPTLRCNRACDFCFNKNMPSMPDMPLEQFRKMLGTLKGLGVKTIDIMGGEPTLHPDIVTMVLEAEGAGFSVNISSNGTDLPVLAQIIDKTGKTAVGISVNDRDELKAMKDFIARRRPVVKSIFQKEMDFGLVEELLALKPKRFSLLYRDAMHNTELGRTVPFDRFILSLREKFGDGQVGMVFCPGFLPDIESYPELGKVRCPAGTTKLGVMPDGSAYPCNLFFGMEKFRLGNILTDSFEKIWSHSALSFFRAFAENACPRTSCELHAGCHGGCPAHGLVHSGKLSAADPRCKKAG